MERAWKRNVTPSHMEQGAGRMDSVKDGLEDALEEAKDGCRQEDRDSAPRERITAEDREAVEPLIAQKK